MPNSIGLDALKIDKILEDWNLLIDLIEDTRVQGSRIKLKSQLLELERNPLRAIKRILRLLQECAITSNCLPLVNTRFMSPTSVESVLVGTLGAHQFQAFCELLATVVKIDYGLDFFKAIVCACVRKEIHPKYKVKNNYDAGNNWKFCEISEDEKKVLASLGESAISKLVSTITTLFVRTLEGLINRYNGVLGYLTADPRRFGFQMRALKTDMKIRDTIIDLLCVQEHKDPIALTWLVDEVTLWSMD